MDLFPPNSSTNILPYDGTVRYHGIVMSHEEAQNYYDALMSKVPWKNDEAVIFGRHIVTARKVAWYGDSGFSYTYSGTTKEALPWSNELLALKALAEEHTAMAFNSCLLNLYHSGDEGMGWHSDDEKSLVKNSAIASLSFGAERRFDFKHKRTGEKVSLPLVSGSLLVMQGETQKHWRHQLPKSKKVTAPRINLTFRSMAASHSGHGR